MKPVMPARLAALGIVLTATLAAAQSAPADWSAVDRALGARGAAAPGGVWRVGFPRRDLKVTVRGVAVNPSFALGSSAAFKAADSEAMVMGDLALRDEEVPRVMSGLAQSGLAVTALHNHLNEMSPHVMYMHFSGHGNAEQLARGLHRALGQLAPAPGAIAAAPPAVGASSFDVKAIDTILGREGRLNSDGIYQITVPRAEKITEGGVELPPGMGVATAINFQPGQGRAAITGDFVLVDSEVAPVARTLRDGGIDVTALHNHGLADVPRLFYMHFWATGDAPTLARGLRAALDQTHSAPAGGTSTLR